MKSSNYFSRNQATYGKDSSTSPLYLGLINFSENHENKTVYHCLNNSENCYLTNVASGQNFEFFLCILDSYGQIMTLEEGFAFITISSSENEEKNYELRGIKTSKIKQGEFLFQSVLIIGTPNTTINIIVTTDIIPEFQTNFLKENNFHKINTKTNEYYLQIKVD